MSAGQDGGAAFVPGSYGCHEAMHMASVLLDVVDTHLCEHRAIKHVPEWRALAGKAHEALFDLYQAIGAKHMDAPARTAAPPARDGGRAE